MAPTVSRVATSTATSALAALITIISISCTLIRDKSKCHWCKLHGWPIFDMVMGVFFSLILLISCMGRARRSALTTRLAKAPCCLFHEKVEEMYRKTADKGMEEWKKEGGKSRFKSVGSVDNAVANERTATVVEDLGRALQVDGVKSEAAQAAQGAPPPYTA